MGRQLVKVKTLRDDLDLWRADSRGHREVTQNI